MISQTLADLERMHIQRVLEHHGGNISQAARTLGIYRSSLQRKMRKLGVDPLEFRPHSVAPSASTQGERESCGT